MVCRPPCAKKPFWLAHTHHKGFSRPSLVLWCLTLSLSGDDYALTGRGHPTTDHYGPGHYLIFRPFCKTMYTGPSRRAPHGFSQRGSCLEMNWVGQQSPASSLDVQMKRFTVVGSGVLRYLTWTKTGKPSHSIQRANAAFTCGWLQRRSAPH